jgi:hypothetical protein
MRQINPATSLTCLNIENTSNERVQVIKTNCFSSDAQISMQKHKKYEKVR